MEWADKAGNETTVPVGTSLRASPNAAGFDYFYGYTHARNIGTVIEQNRVVANVAEVETQPLLAKKVVEYLNDPSRKQKPFFLYLPLCPPHTPIVPTSDFVGKSGIQGKESSYGDWMYQGDADQDWPEPDKGQAAMISRLDGYVGRLLAKLRELGIAENTLVIFTSDNGPHNESNHNLARFNPAAPFTGIKRSLTDGGIRVPMIAWWPGNIAASKETPHVGYFGDWMATAAELSGAKTPPGCDSISFLPTLLGNNETQQQHAFLYWEFHEGGFKQAALYQGRWKGIRSGKTDAPVILYDQQTDIEEKNNVADKHPEIAVKIATYLQAARNESADWVPKWNAGNK